MRTLNKQWIYCHFHGTHLITQKWMKVNLQQMIAPSGVVPSDKSSKRERGKEKERWTKACFINIQYTYDMFYLTLEYTGTACVCVCVFNSLDVELDAHFICSFSKMQLFLQVTFESWNHCFQMTEINIYSSFIKASTVYQRKAYQKVHSLHN